MTQTADSIARDRRGFLRLMGAAPAAAAAVVALDGGQAAAGTETAEERKKPRYRETEHVKSFYRVNRY